MSESSEWVAWVGPARQGDVDHIEKLEQHFSPFVHAVLLSRLSHHTAGALVRPVLAKAMTQLSSVSVDANFGSFLLMAARERALEAAKIPGATVDQPGADALVNNGHLVLAKMRMLAETARERLTMRLLEGIAGFEIAEVSGAREADVRSELERAATILVQQLTGESVSFAGDSYLWSLIGAPHPGVIPLENQLTSLRYSSLFDPELTPAQVPMAIAARSSAPEGKRLTGARLSPIRETTEPSGGALETLANPLPAREANPFGTSVKTIHASDLPAAADFADLNGTRPEAFGEADDLEQSTQANQIPPAVARLIEETKVAVEEKSTQARPSGNRPRRTLPPPVETPDELEEHETTTILPGTPKGWKGSKLTGRPEPKVTVMGLPAIVVAGGSVTRSWRPFGIAGVFALIAIGVALLLFDGTGRRVRAGWALVPVVVAATELTEGTIITAEMVSQRSVPEQFITSSVIKPDSTQYVINQKILVPVQAGDPMLWSQFEVARSNERLSKKIMRRARAYDLKTTKAIAVGGWVQPNDRIDIITSLKGEKGSRMALTLLQNVPVLTTGKITSSTPNSVRRDGDKDYVDVSVLLLPEEAEIVALANEVGELQFTLRHDDDHEVMTDHRGTNSKTLLQGERVRLLQLKRMKTIQTIRSTKAP